MSDGVLSVLRAKFDTVFGKPVSYTHLDVYKRQGLRQPLKAFSIFSAREIKSILVLPQVGHDTICGQSFFMSTAVNISKPAETASTGSAVRETRIVSPMPSIKSEPIPAADLMSPIRLSLIHI